MAEEGSGERWLTPDPGNAGADPANPQSWNAYSYAGNNPTTNTDPDGLDCLYLSSSSTTSIDVGVERGSCSQQSGIYVNGTVDVNSLTYTGTSLGFSYTRGGMLGTGTIDFSAGSSQDQGLQTLSQAGQMASAQIKSFVKDVGIAVALGPVLGLASIPEEGAAEEGTASFLETVSRRNLKHIAKHLPEFQALNPSLTVDDLVQIGKDIVRSPGTRVGPLRFEKIVEIGGVEVKVRAVVNAIGGLGSVYIVR